MSNPSSGRKKILILGGSGFIGRHLFARLGAEHAVATFHSHPFPGGLRYDAETMSLSDVVTQPEQFSHAVVLLGIMNPDACARDRERSDFLNVTRIRQLLDELQQFNICPVFTSTEVVFDGSKGNYVETDAPHSLLAYGKQKVQVEHYLEERFPHYLVIRLPRVLGSQRRDRSLLTSWLEQVERDKDIRCANDHIFSPLYVDEAVEGMCRLMQLGSHGIYHLAGPEAHNRLDMLHMLLECWNAHRPYQGRVTSCPLHEFAVLEKRPLNVSMSPAKVVGETGLILKPFQHWAKYIVEAWVRAGNP